MKSGLKVEGVSLSNHEITDVGVGHLCKLLNDDSAYNYYSLVTSLELRGNSIGSKGCEQLASALSANKKLKKLDLSWNPIGMRGGFRLAEMLVSNVGLEVLRVGNVDFTTDTLIALLSLLRTNEVILEFDCQNPRLFSRQEDTTKHVARVLELNHTRAHSTSPNVSSATTARCCSPSRCASTPRSARSSSRATRSAPTARRPSPRCSCRARAERSSSWSFRRTRSATTARSRSPTPSPRSPAACASS